MTKYSDYSNVTNKENIEVIVMRSLAKNNCIRYNVSRFFDTEMFMSLVLRCDKECVDREIDLIIGKRRKYSISAKANKGCDVYILTSDNDDVYLSYDKVNTIVNEKTGREEIDLEKYLISKGITYNQLESKKYQREKNSKKYNKWYSEINKCGQFSGDYYWMDIDVYTASADFFPKGCKLDDIDVVNVSYEAFYDFMVKDIRDLTKKHHVWDKVKFEELFINLSQCNNGLIRIQNGSIKFGGFFGGEVEISRNFEAGKFVLKREFVKYGEGAEEQKIRNLATIAYGILKASSLEACEGIENKALMLGII